jgi:quinol monooxygenase YgiN
MRTNPGHGMKLAVVIIEFSDVPVRVGNQLRIENQAPESFKPPGIDQKVIVMIVVRITMNALADKHLEVTQTLLSLIEPVGKEKGCKSFHVFCDINDKNHFCLLEEWETRENLDRHIRSCRFGVFLGIKPLLQEPLDIMIYTIPHSQGMEAIEAIRAKGAPYDENIVNLP